jgi:membrane protein DedA with SNARE-associated domain
MEGVLAFLADLFARYGYWVVFVGVFLEAIVVVGMFTPGDWILLLAGAYAAQGLMNPWWVGLLAAVGGVLGSVVSYRIGSHGGYPALHQYGHRVGVTDERIALSQAYFDAHGAKTVFVGRFATGIKAWIPALAGASRMPWPIFLGYTIAASCTWAVLLTTVGYFVGANVRILRRILMGMGWGAFVLVAVIIGLAWWRHRIKVRRELELEAALGLKRDDPTDGDSH